MGSTAKILVVEDDVDINEAVSNYLSKRGYEVFSVTRTETAKNYLNRVDLIILDLQLPDGDGLEFLKKIRTVDDTPVLITSGRGAGTHRIAGLELGADDYLVKPILPRELLARVKAVLKRTLRQRKALEIQVLSLDEQARVVKVGEKEISLSPQEFQVLQALNQKPGRTFTRGELMEVVWREPQCSDTRKVDLMISRVRTKFADGGLDCSIKSVRGKGYRIVCPNS